LARSLDCRLFDSGDRHFPKNARAGAFAYDATVGADVTESIHAQHLGRTDFAFHPLRLWLLRRHRNCKDDRRPGHAICHPIIMSKALKDEALMGRQTRLFRNHVKLLFGG
jgi:hypothetical protein